MERHETKVSIGQHVMISRPSSTHRFVSMERVSTVTAVRPKSFDAGGLCFRNDGREWNGRNRVVLIPDEHEVAVLARAGAAVSQDRAARAKEDATLAFLLSCQHEKQWLKLGLEELRRIAALHGLTGMAVHP